jgi:two-component system response regulator GlrR
LCQHNDKPARAFSSDAMECLISAPWPGNVRQLFNVVEQTVTLATTSVIPVSLVQKALRHKTGTLPSLAAARRDFEREYLVRLLQMTDGNITQAARFAQRNRTELYKLLRRYHLDPGSFRNNIKSAEG